MPVGQGCGRKVQGDFGRRDLRFFPDETTRTKRRGDFAMGDFDMENDGANLPNAGQ